MRNGDAKGPGARVAEVIINADDFGRHAAANRGIVAGFELGLVSSTTLMANQPGFDEAVQLAHERRLGKHIGVHLVLTEGVPLTEAIRRRSRFCDAEGRLKMWEAGLGPWRLAEDDRTSLAEELRAQIERVRRAGLPVTHVDSHHQVHNHWAIGTCVIAVCRELGVPFVRLARNCGPGIRRVRAQYKHRYNNRLRRAGLARTQYFGVPADWSYMQASGATASMLDDFEVMTHPEIDADDTLVDSFSGAELVSLLASIEGVDTAVSYSGARLG